MVKQLNFKLFLKKAVTLLLLGCLLLNLGLSVINYSEAAGYNSLGSTKALGSPVLNPQAVSDDWNIYETLVWGIYLSNFCTPFLDDYESAFNLNAGYGSKGSGTKALIFGSGSDGGMSQTIKDLTSYAIRNQSTAYKEIRVSYNRMVAGAYVMENVYTANTSNTSAFESVERKATLNDLIMAVSDEAEGTELTTSTWANFVDHGNSWDLTAAFSAVNYANMMGIRDASIPTFAVKGASGNNEIILDYRDPYDMSMMSGAICSALSGDFADDVKANMTNAYASAASIPLYLDNYGNICMMYTGKFIVIIPAAANQYLTKEPSLNLLNSIVFNSSTSSSTVDEMVLMGGQKGQGLGFFGNIASWGHNLIVNGQSDDGNDLNWVSGSLALANGTANTNYGGMALFYDTDTIVYSAYAQNSHYKEFWEHTRSLIGAVTDVVNLTTLSVPVVGATSFTVQSAMEGVGSAIAYVTETVSGYNFGNLINMAELQSCGLVSTDGEELNDIVSAAMSGDIVINTGAMLKALYDAELGDENCKLQFKIEPTNVSDDLFDGTPPEFYQTVIASAPLINMTGYSDNIGKTPRLDYLLKMDTNSSDDKVELFSESVVIPVQSDPGVVDGKKNVNAVIRTFANYAYDCYKGRNGTDPEDKQLMENILAASKSPLDIMAYLVTTTGPQESAVWNDVDASKLFVKFMKLHDGSTSSIALYNIKDPDKLSQIRIKDTFSKGWNGGPAYMLLLHDVGLKDGGWSVGSTDAVHSQAVAPLFDQNGASEIMFFEGQTNVQQSQRVFGRTIKVFYSPVLKQVADVLGMRSGTDFAAYASNIYLTYIDWYELEVNEMNGEMTCNLNTNILDNEGLLIKDISDVANIKSQEEKEQEIINYTYLMLSPTEGESYRSSIMSSNTSNWIYNQYQRLVYGGASEYYYSNVSTRNNTGFLAVENYADNFMTKWFMDEYATYAIVIIGLGLVVMVIIGALKKRKLAWFFLASVMIVNVVLVMPATGEIVPYISNKVTQSIFDNKMTYWSISEQINNATSEKDLVSSSFTSDLTSEQKEEVNSLVRQLKTLYLDRYINIKQDISNKITQMDSETYQKIQSLRSARWMLPMVLRQFTATDGSANYVYVPLGDKLDDYSNIYWFYMPDDATYVDVYNTKVSEATPTEYNWSNVLGTDPTQALNNVSNLWSGFTVLDNSMTYRCESYFNDASPNLHNYFYMLNSPSGSSLIDVNFSNVSYANYESFDDWAQAYSEYAENNVNSMFLREASQIMQTKADKYNRFSRDTVDQTYAYLLTTESPMPYFYTVVKDSFRTDATLGVIVSELQGVYTDNANGVEYRKCFLTDDTTGAVKDVTDMEAFFKNLTPYMYTLYISAGGYDEESGVFGNDLMTEYSVYKDNEISWMFRSNWIIKLMENPVYTKPSTIHLADGSIVTVQNQLMPQCYLDVGREMVFSRAQMEQQGLDEAALSLVELKCVEVNDEVSKQWTLMLNYVSAKGMSKEVLIRQMAVSATTVFCDVFTNGGVTNLKYALTPSSLDLRSVSFDSVMCMLMLSVTHDTSYTYGDTMEVLVDDSDLFTAVLLLIVAFLCTYLIPLVRCLALGLMFFLGYFAMLRVLFQDNNQKIKSSLGYLGSHVIYLVVNILYLLAFKILMSVTTSDEVLSVSTVEMSTGNPVWCLLVVLVISVLFIVASYKMIKFCIKNYYDMGFTAIKSTIEMVSTNISSSMEKLQGKVVAAAEGARSDTAGTGAGSYSTLNANASTSGRGGSGGSGGKDGSRGSRDSGGSGGQGSSGGYDYTGPEGDYVDGPGESDEFNYTKGNESSKDGDPSDIDATIDRGKAKQRDLNNQDYSDDSYNGGGSSVMDWAHSGNSSSDYKDEDRRGSRQSNENSRRNASETKETRQTNQSDNSGASNSSDAE